MSMLYHTIKRKVWRAAISQYNKHVSSNDQTTKLEKEINDKNLQGYKRNGLQELPAWLLTHPDEDTSLTPYIIGDHSPCQKTIVKRHQDQYLLQLPKEKRALLPLKYVSMHHDRYINKRSRRYSFSKDMLYMIKKCENYNQKHEKRILHDNNMLLDNLLGIKTASSKSKSKSSSNPFYNVRNKENVSKLGGKDSSLHRESLFTTTKMQNREHFPLQQFVDPLPTFTPKCNGEFSKVNQKRNSLEQLGLNSLYYCVGTGNESTPEESKDIQDRPERPSLEQLTKIKNYLADYVPVVLHRQLNYKLVRRDVIFENNWVTEPYTTVGFEKYAIQHMRLNMKVHLKYVDVAVRILKMTIEEEHGTVAVRWQMRCLPQMTALKFWLFLPFVGKADLSEYYKYFDGLSTISVDATGLIYKHSVDFVQTDEKKPVVLNPIDRVKQKLARKLQQAVSPA